eukprot:gene3883-15185_t
MLGPILEIAKESQILQSFFQITGYSEEVFLSEIEKLALGIKERYSELHHLANEALGNYKLIIEKILSRSDSGSSCAIERDPLEGRAYLEKIPIVLKPIGLQRESIVGVKRKSRGWKKKAKLADHFTSVPHKLAIIRLKNFQRKESHVNVAISAAKKQQVILLPDKIKTCNASQVKQLCDVFPNDLKDPDALLAEMEKVGEDISNSKTKNLREAAMLLQGKRKFYPYLGKAYQLALTIPISVASNEHSFRRLKMISACAVDVLDCLDLDKIVGGCSELKTRKIRP